MLTQAQVLAEDIVALACDDLLTTSYLSDRFRRPVSTVRDALFLLERSGRIERVGHIRRTSRGEIAWRLKETTHALS